MHYELINNQIFLTYQINRYLLYSPHRDESIDIYRTPSSQGHQFGALLGSRSAVLLLYRNHAQAQLCQQTVPIDNARGRLKRHEGLR